MAKLPRDIVSKLQGYIGFLQPYLRYEIRLIVVPVRLGRDKLQVLRDLPGVGRDPFSPVYSHRDMATYLAGALMAAACRKGR